MAEIYRQMLGCNREIQPFGLMKLTKEQRDAVSKVLDLIEEKAEANMLTTHKLEGMHYAALKEVREQLKIPRRKR